MRSQVMLEQSQVNVLLPKLGIRFSSLFFGRMGGYVKLLNKGTIVGSDRPTKLE